MQGRKNILFVEDETSLRDSITLNLELEGFQVMALERGARVADLLANKPFDLLILDVMLPEIDGISLCKKLRELGQNLPILLLSAKSDSIDRALGLQAGADDYMVKPFELAELIFRINKLLIKGGQRLNGDNIFYEVREYVFAGGNRFFPHTLTAITYNQEQVVLTKKETQLLKLLLDNKNTTIERERILGYWGHSAFSNTRTIDNVILRLRKLFEPYPANPRYFISRRGIGYAYLEEEF